MRVGRGKERESGEKSGERLHLDVVDVFRVSDLLKMLYSCELCVLVNENVRLERRKLFIEKDVAAE